MGTHLRVLLSTKKVASALERLISYFLMDIYFHLVAALTFCKPRIIVVYIEDKPIKTALTFYRFDLTLMLLVSNFGNTE